MQQRIVCAALAGVLALAGASVPGTAPARDWEVRGFLENWSHYRESRGVSKSRNTAQVELERDFGARGLFSGVVVNGIFRGSYDAAYDLNDGQFGDTAGGPVALGGVPYGGGLIPLDGGVVGGPGNPNDGLRRLGVHSHGGTRGVILGVPVRPCDEDPRGCFESGYMDLEEDELRFAEFNDRWDFIRELYADLSLPVGDDLMNFRVGKQQVVWGRTDLFRVLDVINPIDYSRNTIYDEFEDTRIPLWTAVAEYRAGPTALLEDLNFQLVWVFDKFRPANLGQGGQPYQALEAGDLFRGLGNCWQNGCTVWNFPADGLSADFGPNQIGIRDVDLPSWSLSNTQAGGRIEGMFRGVGFSLNALYFRQQLPSLRGGTTVVSVDPFSGLPGRYPYAIAFDVAFPRVWLVGGSADAYIDPLKSVLRVETAWTSGEEFANTADPQLYSEHDVVRYVIGVDRPTFIRALNRRTAFFISAQLFGQHIRDHVSERTPFGRVGIPDWKDNWIATFLISGSYRNGQVLPKLIFARDFRAHSNVISPQLDWLLSNRWHVTVGANIKFGEGPKTFDDNRSAVPYPSIGGPLPSTGALAGFEPLGRFRAGIFGMQREEDEYYVALRYRF
jgi:hypothetical protein